MQLARIIGGWGRLGIWEAGYHWWQQCSSSVQLYALPATTVTEWLHNPRGSA